MNENLNNYNNVQMSDELSELQNNNQKNNRNQNLKKY